MNVLTVPSYPLLFLLFLFLHRLILPDCKKRRRTEPLEVQNHLVAVPIAAGSESAGGDVPSYDSDGAIGSSSGMGAYQLLSWDRYQPSLWTTLYNSNYDIL